MMRKLLWIALAFGILACHKSDVAASKVRFGDATDATDAAGPGHQSAGYVITKTSPELRQRADSLAALDPIREARAAVRAGDLRYLAVCRTSCAPIGTTGDSVCLLQGCANERRADVHAIPGLDAPVMNADVARLDTVATAYGTRYNQIIHDARRHRKPSRPVT
jgi:hypothetical protein